MFSDSKLSNLLEETKQLTFMQLKHKIESAKLKVGELKESLKKCSEPQIEVIAPKLLEAQDELYVYQARYNKLASRTYITSRYKRIKSIENSIIPYKKALETFSVNVEGIPNKKMNAGLKKQLTSLGKAAIQGVIEKEEKRIAKIQTSIDNYVG